MTNDKENRLEASLYRNMVNAIREEKYLAGGIVTGLTTELIGSYIDNETVMGIGMAISVMSPVVRAMVDVFRPLTKLEREIQKYIY